MTKEDINLPKTSFSMKANLPNKEPEILKIWEKLNLYKKLLTAVENKSVYLEEYARSQIGEEEQHSLELKIMLKDFS